MSAFHPLQKAAEHPEDVEERCKSCGRRMAADNFFSECWRCSFANVLPVAPFAWFGLFATLLALTLWLWP